MTLAHTPTGLTGLHSADTLDGQPLGEIGADATALALELWLQPSPDRYRKELHS